MVAKITTGKNVYGALAYNQQKVDRGKVLLAHILREPPDGRFDIATTAEDLLRWMPSHYRTEKPVVHDEDGNDRMKEVVQENYERIKAEASQIVAEELERIKNDPVLCKLLPEQE